MSSTEERAVLERGGFRRVGSRWIENGDPGRRRLTAEQALVLIRGRDPLEYARPAEELDDALPGEPIGPDTGAPLPGEPGVGAEADSDGGRSRAIELLPFVTLPDFVARVDEQAREPLVGRSERSFLPRGGLGVVGGVGGSTKTTFMLDAVAHFASGTTWHEFEVPRALRHALIDVEGPREPLRQKIEHKVSVWPGEPFAERVVILDGPTWGDFSFAREEDRRRLRHTCAELAVDLVVCNPLGRLGMPGGGTPEEVGTFVGWLRECGLWQDLAFLLLHHFNRGLHRDVLLRLSGAWDRDADTIVGLAREGERRTKLTWAKLRWALDGGPAESVEILEWDIPTLGFRRVEKPEAVGVSPEEMRRRVLEALADSADWRSTKAIREAVGGRGVVVDQALRELFEEGLARLSVVRPGNEVESVVPEQWDDWGRLRTAKYWKPSSGAASQSSLDLRTTGDDQGRSTPEEGGSRPVVPPPVGRDAGGTTTHRGRLRISAADPPSHDAPAAVLPPRELRASQNPARDIEPGVEA